MVQDWYIVTIQALQNLWQLFLTFLPKFIGAIIVFIIGWFIALGVGKLIAKILQLVRLNQLFARSGWDEALEKAGLKADVAGFIGVICKWILVIVFLLAAVEILGFVQFASFLNNVISWLPNVIVAVAIFVVAVIVADILEKIVVAAVEKTKFGFANFAGVIVRWSIYVFAILAILLQLGIAPALIQMLFAGLVGMLAISAGLAFGLGGKELASDILDNLRKKLKG
jgi:hypothetical protein